MSGREARRGHRLLRRHPELDEVEEGGSVAVGWKDRELLASCFKVDLVGATGSGDCTVAGFLAGLVKGMGPEDVMTSAVAVGACNVEKMDATSGVPAWEAVQERIRSGWERRPVNISLSGGNWDNSKGIWNGGR